MLNKTIFSIYLVNQIGEVIRAWVQYGKNNRKERPIASKGEFGSRESYKLRPTKKSMFTQTPSGQLKVDEVSIYRVRTDLKVVKTNNMMISELSFKVPFKTLKMYQIENIQEGILLKALNYAEDYLIDKLPIGTIKKALEQILPKENKDIKLEYVLTEYGFVK